MHSTATMYEESMLLSEITGVWLPTWLAYCLLALTVLLISGLVFLVFHYRGQVVRLLPHTRNAPSILAPTWWHPDHISRLRERLCRLQEEHDSLREAYGKLMARYQALYNQQRRVHKRPAPRLFVKSPVVAPPDEVRRATS